MCNVYRKFLINKLFVTKFVWLVIELLSSLINMDGAVSGTAMICDLSSNEINILG